MWTLSEEAEEARGAGRTGSRQGGEGGPAGEVRESAVAREGAGAGEGFTEKVATGRTYPSYYY